MPHVINRNYSRHFDIGTGTEFAPIIDPVEGVYIAHAEVSEELAARFAERPGFEVLADDAYALFIALPAAPEPEESPSGSPLADAANATPPAPEPRKPPKAKPDGDKADERLSLEARAHKILKPEAETPAKPTSGATPPAPELGTEPALTDAPPPPPSA